ncbi:glycosyltransferase family 25 protein [Hyphomicrobium sp.]|uniref:glycosyltransferase family 25 protein n=1 Tax=Hyphomicrobium sp. TaxID=82 RepID=UPI002D77FFAE|nr:glycosyltransferase family 25 protein [Hyphomicrobium sp.]HET6387966.1 glycosyltransferase family 25 protein [Hyphomicrobium sp.]
MDIQRIPTFFINLDRDTFRRELIEEELARAGLAGERLSAIEGRSVPDWLRSYYGCDLSDAEVGCSASHLVICKRILERGLPYALTFEDDAHLAEHSRDIIEAAIANAPQGWDVIRLIESSSQPFQALAELGFGRSLVRYLRVPRSTTGIIVSTAGARKLLSPRVIREPIDVEIRWPWQLDLNVYGIEAPIVSQKSGVSLESTIPIRQRPKKFNQLQRLVFNVRKFGPADYLRCRFLGANVGVPASQPSFSAVPEASRT